MRLRGYFHAQSNVSLNFNIGNCSLACSGEIVRMLLEAFILENIEPILAEWETYAKSIWPAIEATPVELRDHAEAMLVAVAMEMGKPQSAHQKKEKSLGRGDNKKDARQLDRASHVHADNRFDSGFDLRQLVAEYRALRASVIRLWQKSNPVSEPNDFENLLRFNEAIDQLLAESVFTHTARLDKSRELFLAILGHDLRNPLSAVAGLAGLLREENLDPSSLELVTHITTGTDFMAKLVEDLLEFAAMRITNGVIISPAPMDLLPLGRDAVAEMKAIHPDREFHLEHQGDLTGEWDKVRLRQLLSNLLGNAAQHGATDQPIAVSLEAADDQAVIVVRNQGIPIPAKDLETIFEPMKRYARGEDRSSHGGVGLGLFIASEIAAAHGGSIEAQSDDQETYFTVSLPRISRRNKPVRKPVRKS